MSGHVFVTRGDIRKLACDAWLVPTGGIRHVTHTFWSEADGFDQRLRGVGAWNSDKGMTCPPGNRGAWADRRAIPIDPDPLPGPRPWLAWVTGRQTEHPIAGAREFVQRAAADPHRHLRSREKRLLALPVVGTGHGGLHQEAGDLLEGLLPALREDVEALDVDVALVAFSEPHYAAAQAVRRSRTPGGWWPELTNEAAGEAMRLGQLASLGRLVVFFGAGLSQGAGLPTWRGLLELLAASAGMDGNLRQRISSLAALDHAQIVARCLRASGRNEGDEVRRLLLPFDRYGLAHAVLASLPVDELITTNYDSLFESASADAGKPATALPYAPATDGSRWVLKMHGCVEHPDDIILTRESYLRYAERNAALAGIVQAMLITRHMLFLGFSLSDDNFHRIVDAVRRALRPQGGAGVSLLGSAVMLHADEHLEDLWRDEIDWIKLPDGRSVDIFLDRLGFEAASPAYLLDPRFEALLDKPGRELRDLLSPVVRARRGLASRSPAWPLVDELLKRLGAR